MAGHLEAVLAGLVHDLGKLGQRACPPGEGLSPAARGLEAMICPSTHYGSSHLHSLYTAEFALKHLPYLPPGMDPEKVLRLAAYHHRPSTPEEGLLARADRLSAGMERLPREGAGEAAGSFRRVRLQAVAAAVELPGRGPLRQDKSWAFPLEPLSPAAAFPQAATEARDQTEAYARLWAGLAEAWATNRVSDPWAFLSRALSVVEQYTWCVPSATNVQPDISLYDHLKTTAALAGCLALAGESCAEPFLLVSGELGGIQGYLYGLQVGPGGLARRLRGRSLYVSLVAENTAHQLLREADLPLTNCLISAGGHFLLLLPNTPQAQAAVERTRAGLARWAREQVSCELHPHLAAVPVGEADLTDFPACLRRLGAVMRQEQAQPLRTVLQGPAGWDPEAFVLPPLTAGAEGGMCASCARRAGRERPAAGPAEPAPRLCDHCHEQAQWGRRLVSCRYVAFLEEEGALPFGAIRLVEREEQLPAEAYLAMDLEGGYGELPESPVVGRRLARHVPRDESGEVMEFSRLAEAGEGYAALGCLKADVDYLGAIFTQGLTGGSRPQESARASISRLTTLSRSLELFFSGQVEELARQGGGVYLVYSGGDDLLALGPWSAMVEFAGRLRESFEGFTCENPSWTLSAGLTLVTRKTPVLLAAAEADRRLEAAKQGAGGGARPFPDRESATAASGDLSAEQPAKDRLVAFGTCLPWEALPAALNQARRLALWLGEGQLTSGQARRLLGYARLYQHWQRTGEVWAFRYAPHLVYDLSRNWRRAPVEARQWAEELTLRHSQGMPLLNFVCEHALYSVRSAEGSRD